MKTEASDHTMQFEILDSNVSYAEDEISGFSGRGTDKKDLFSQMVVVTISREADE